MSLLALSLVLATPFQETELVPFDSPAWHMADVDGSLTEHLGRPSLELRSGMLLLEDAGFENGVLEVDVALPRERGFIGVVWRVQSFQDYEHFYLRPHQTGQPDSCQYTPVFHGLSAWQLHTGPGYSEALALGFDRWTHVKVVVWEGTAWIFVDSEEPVLVARLGREPEAGGIGVIVPGFAAAHFADFRWAELVEPPSELESLEPPSPPPASPDHTAVDEWQVSDAFALSDLIGRARLDGAESRAWTTLAAAANGLTNLARVQGVESGRDTCFVRRVVRSDEAQVVPLELGFSDRARVYLNGVWLFEGRDGYRSRDERFLGTIGYFDTVPLALLAGDNELLIAVTEAFGGWGVQARFPRDAAIELR